MGSVRRFRDKWRAEVFKDHRRASKVCRTKAEAAAWVLQKEAELTGRALPLKTFADACDRYAEEVAPHHKGERWEQVRTKSLKSDPISSRRLESLSASDWADWRDRRLGQVSPATVLREMNLIRSVLECCRRDWGWLRENPLRDVRKPSAPPARRRRINAEECRAVEVAFGVDQGLCALTVRHRVGLAFLFALETAMRSGEICGLTWADVEIERRFVRLPMTKNGDAREVPLSARAVEILEALPREGRCFGMADSVRDSVWRQFRPVPDLHFHDTRGEAIWRLSKKLDVLQLARMIGHRDPRSLMSYYRESAEDMAKLL